LAIFSDKFEMNPTPLLVAGYQGEYFTISFGSADTFPVAIHPPSFAAGYSGIVIKKEEIKK